MLTPAPTQDPAPATPTTVELESALETNQDAGEGGSGEGAEVGMVGECTCEEGEKDGEKVHVDEFTDMMRILRGDFTNLPPAKTNIIRIFLSSTFSGICICKC